MNNRRKLVIALGASALAAPFSSFAQQQGKVWRIGFLGTRRPISLDTDTYGAFARGMRELGYVEGNNLIIEWSFADGHYERLPELAVELVRLKVDAIVTTGNSGTDAAQKVTSMIPIIMGNGSDPVRLSFVKTLAHPGGNITGVTSLGLEVIPKHLEMLLTIEPKISRVAIMGNSANAVYANAIKIMQSAAQRTRATILTMEASTVQEIENAFSTMAQGKIEAFVFISDGFLNQQARQIAGLAEKHRLPSISANPRYAEAGGLMSYGPDYREQFRRAATYVDKIFKGAKPADLPVEQPTKFELVINMKTAKALGIKIPNSILVQATKVIE